MKNNDPEFFDFWMFFCLNTKEPKSQGCINFSRNRRDPNSNKFSLLFPGQDLIKGTAMCPDALEGVLEKFHDLRIFFFLEKKETKIQGFMKIF